MVNDEKKKEGMIKSFKSFIPELPNKVETSNFMIPKNLNWKTGHPRYQEVHFI